MDIGFMRPVNSAYIVIAFSVVFLFQTLAIAQDGNVAPLPSQESQEASTAGRVAEEKKEEPLGGSFVEHFDHIDQSRWIASHGWSNGPHQKCTWSIDNVHHEKGTLRLILKELPAAKHEEVGPASSEKPQAIKPETAGAASPEKPQTAKTEVAEGASSEPAHDLEQNAAQSGKPEDKSFTCAEIQTRARYGYGTYEVHMRAAAAPGLVSAFFTFVGPQMGIDSPHDEIDFEFLGKNTNQVQVNYLDGAQGEHAYLVDLGFDASQIGAAYAFEWLEGSIRWFVNGKLVHEVYREPGRPYPVTPSKILLSIWNGEGLENWLERFEYPGKPLVAHYDLVAYTKAEDPCQFPESLVCTLEADGKASQSNTTGAN